MHVFAPHGAPRYPRAAGDIAREVREDIRWLTSVTDSWDGREDKLSAMGGEAAIVMLTVFCGSRARARSPFKARVHLGHTGSQLAATNHQSPATSHQPSITGQQAVGSTQ